MATHKITKFTKEGPVTAWRKLEENRNPKLDVRLGDIVGTSPWGDWYARPRSCAKSLIYKYPENMTDQGKHTAQVLVGRIQDMEELGINALRHEARKATSLED